MNGKTALNQDRPEGFSRDLEAIALQATAEKITIGEIELALEGRGFAAVIVILSVPFVQPIPLPGLSLPFGFAIMALGARIALGKSAGLPHLIKRREIDTERLKRILAGAQKLFGYVERFFKKRLTVMLRPPLRNLMGVSMVFSGFALSLPLPPVILFSNSLPAWSIILLCIGLIEGDGLFVSLGHLLAVATWIYFAFWLEAVRYAVANLLPFLA